MLRWWVVDRCYVGGWYIDVTLVVDDVTLVGGGRNNCHSEISGLNNPRVAASGLYVVYGLHDSDRPIGAPNILVYHRRYCNVLVITHVS